MHPIDPPKPKQAVSSTPLLVDSEDVHGLEGENTPIQLWPRSVLSPDQGPKLDEDETTWGLAREKSRGKHILTEGAAAKNMQNYEGKWLTWGCVRCLA